MVDADAKTIEALIVALPESAGSAIYGLDWSTYSLRPARYGVSSSATNPADG